MAFPTSINDQTTDAITESSVTNLAESPAIAMASIFQTAAQTQGLAFANAVSQQQGLSQIAQAIAARCVSSLLGRSNARE